MSTIKENINTPSQMTLNVVLARRLTDVNKDGTISLGGYLYNAADR